MPKYTIYFLTFLGTLFTFSTTLQAQEINDLLAKYESAKGDDERVATGLQIARVYYTKQETEEALKYYFKTQNIVQKQGKSNSLATIYEEMGNVYQSWQGYERSIYYFNEANKLYEAQKKIDAQKNCIRQMAWSSFKLSDYANTQKYYETLLKIYQTQGERTQETDIYTRLSVIAEMRKQEDEAIQYAEKSLAIQEVTKDYENQSKTLNNLGVLYRKIGQQKKSLSYFNQAIELYKTQITKTKNIDQKAQLNSNLGVVYTNMRDFDTAIKYHELAYQLRQGLKMPSKTATIHNQMAANHYLNKNNERAKIEVNDALRLAQPLNDSEVLSDSYLILSNIYKSEGNLAEYEKYNKEYNKAQKEIDAKNNKNIQELLNKKFSIEIFDNGLKLANTEEEKQKSDKKASEEALKASKAEAARAKADQERAEARAETQRAEAERARAIANTAEKDREIALAKERQAQQEKDLALSQASEETAKRAAAIAESKTAKAERAQALAEAAQAKKDKQRLEAEQKGRNQLYLFSAIIAFVVLILIFIVISYLRNRKKNRLLQAKNDKISEQNASLEQQKEEIETQRDAIIEEQRKSDLLLLNILPVEVAKELKEKGYATPKFYESATILFTDFKGFTNAAAKMTPQEVIKALDVCFLAFDEISEKYGLEKIKTIGDAYMCAGGIPVVNTTHSIDAVKAALEIQAFMQKMKLEKEAKGEPYWELRVGLNTGALVAGVVGKNKFAYDIWGDAVNLASRMESSGEPGKVNISGFTYELIKDDFEFTHRGKVAAKNKGDVDMYFVDGLKK